MANNFRVQDGIVIPGNLIGNGNLTIQPDPDNSGAHLDVYLTVGPDIHIAGSGENLILGRDNGANVMVSANGNVYIKTDTGIPIGIASIMGSSGSWESNPQNNLSTIGGTGFGLTVNVTESGGYASSISIATTGSGYTDGDIIVVNSGSSNATFTIVVPTSQWGFSKDGNLTIPGNLNYGGLASPAPSINGFSSISVGNIVASGNLDIDGEGRVGGNLVISGNIDFSGGGSINQITSPYGVFTGNVDGSNALYAGAPGYTPLPGAVAQFTGDGPYYLQINAQNLNHGNTASIEYVITGDLGTDTTDYIDIGFSSSTWDGTQENSLGNAAGARDGWVYVQGGGGGGNLILGTTTSGKNIKFVAGGPNTGNVVATISASGLTTSGNVTSGNLITGGLASVTGNVTSGNLRTSGNVAFTANSGAIAFNTGAYISGNASSLTRDGSIVLQPYTGAGSTFPGVLIGGAGRLLAPSGSVHQIFNASDVTFQVAVKAITGAVSTSTTTGAIQITGGAGITGNIYAGGLINATSNITGGNLITGGLLSATGNITGGNLITGGLLSATGNITGGNLITGGLLSATGNITTTGGTFVGNGAGLTNVTVNAAGNIQGTSSNVSLVAGSYTMTFDNTGVATFPGTISTTGNVNSTGFAVGNGAVNNCAMSMTPTAGTPGNYAFRDYSTANSIMFFDTTIGSANTGGSFQFRSSNAYTTLANINSYGVSQPTKPGFRVYGAGTTTNLTTTVNTNGILNGNNYAVDYNQGSHLNTTTGIFTAPVAGLYSVHLVARVSNTSSAQIAILKNYASANTVQAMWECGANCTANHFGVSSIVKLAVGDTLVIKVLLGQINFDSNDNWAIAFVG